MSGAEIGIIITGLGTALVAIIGGIRSLRSDRVSESETRQANLMAGYEGLMESLREDIRRLREEQEAERRAWHEERLRITEENRRLQIEVDRLKTRVAQLERIDRKGE
jgi:malic enzyme